MKQTFWSASMRKRSLPASPLPRLPISLKFLPNSPKTTSSLAFRGRCITVSLPIFEPIKRIFPSRSSAHAKDRLRFERNRTAFRELLGQGRRLPSVRQALEVFGGPREYRNSGLFAVGTCVTVLPARRNRAAVQYPTPPTPYSMGNLGNLTLVASHPRMEYSRDAFFRFDAFL